MISIAVSTDPAFREANAQPTILYRNLLTEGTLANSDLPTTAPRANALSESTFDFWLPASAPDVLQVTFGLAQAADCALIVGHTLGSAGATLNVQYYNGSSWVTQASVTPTDNDPIMILWPSRSATGWGIRITGAAAQIGVIMIGPRLTIPGGVQPGYTPVWAAREITKFPGVSRRGQFTGQRIERVGARLSATLMPVTHAFALSTMRDFRRHYDEGRPFGWAPAPSIFTEDVAYAWAPDGEAIRTPILAGGELVNLTLTMEAYCEP